MEGEEVEEQETKNKKECLFSFSKMNKYFIIPFLCPVIDMIMHTINDLNNELSGNTINNSLLIYLLDCFSLFAGGLLYFVVFIRTKTEETRNKAIIYKESSNDIKYIYNPVELEKNKRKIFIYLIIMSIILSLAYVSLEFQLTIIKEKMKENIHIFEIRIYYCKRSLELFPI